MNFTGHAFLAIGHHFNLLESCQLDCALERLYLIDDLLLKLGALVDELRQINPTIITQMLVLLGLLEVFILGSHGDLRSTDVVTADLCLLG